MRDGNRKEDRKRARQRGSPPTEPPRWERPIQRRCSSGGPPGAPGPRGGSPARSSPPPGPMTPDPCWTTAPWGRPPPSCGPGRRRCPGGGSQRWGAWGVSRRPGCAGGPGRGLGALRAGVENINEVSVGVYVCVCVLWCLQAFNTSFFGRA